MPNRLNFNYFKERLVHFNGTVVIPNREVEKYKYDDHIEHVAFVSDPLNILTCQSSESSVSEAEALKKAKDRYILVILFFGGIGATVCIVSVWIKK